MSEDKRPPRRRRRCSPLRELLGCLVWFLRDCFRERPAWENVADQPAFDDVIEQGHVTGG